MEDPDAQALATPQRATADELDRYLFEARDHAGMTYRRGGLHTTKSGLACWNGSGASVSGRSLTKSTARPRWHPCLVIQWKRNPLVTGADIQPAP